ncbi:hypothetical protein Rhal01_02377 [Rubritalea halochordaticola]|uniref:Stage II sporulation protein M n=1 Tax=Rubritalea halochordaticola TaxID=714537 RepID=A0ABP9V2G5_9BACT
MKVKDFEQKHIQKWNHYEATVAALEKGQKNVADVEEVPKMLRERCNELALARHRMYSVPMCEYLNQQVIRGHKLTVRNSGGFTEKILRFFAVGFPQSIRNEWKLFVLCWLVFLIPLFGMWASIHYDIDWVRSILGSSGMESMDEMYGKDARPLSEGRGETGADFLMFSHYVNNNIGIDFQIVAGGVLAGVGSLFILLMNGLGIGGAMAYVMEYGDPVRFFSFVSGHAPYELTGMVVAGMAGMRIGLGILNPGRMTRGRALLESGKKGLPLVYGAFALTFLAACVEGFWSAGPASSTVKYWVGFAGWAALAYYFIFAGRGKRAA